MTTRFTSQNLQTIFKFPFQDEKWKSKLAVFAAIGLVSILIVPGFFIGGYIYEIMRRIIVKKEEPSLPEWDDLGGYFRNGLKMFGVGFIYGLPALITLIPYFVIVLPMIAMEPIPSEYEPLFLIGMTVSMGLMMVGSLIGIVTQMFSLAAIGYMIEKGEFQAAFRIREWWPIFRKNIGGFILAYVILMGCGWIIGFAIQFIMLTIILCVLVPFLWAAVYAYLGVIGGVLFAQAYNDGVDKLSLE